MLDYTQQSVVARQHIDGVWHNGEARDRESGDVMLAVMKTLANLERQRAPQEAGGQVRRQVQGPFVRLPDRQPGRADGRAGGGAACWAASNAAFKNYEDLGMREAGRAVGRADGQRQGPGGHPAMPEGGLTTLTDVSLMETDRLLRDFVAIEEVHHREREIENIDVTTYDAAKGETPATMLPALIRKYPNVYVLPRFQRRRSGQAADQRSSRRRSAGDHQRPRQDAPEALLRMLQMKVPQREFAAVVTAVLCTRLIRKLCDACKVAYAPTPDLLKKLGIPAGKVEALYRVPKAGGDRKAVQGVRRHRLQGRTGMFELLVVDDKIREILVKQPKLDLLRKAARMAGMRPFQEEGLLLVAKGVTSLAELQRVLKE